MNGFGYSVCMLSVTIQLREGETKYAAILRVLRCASLAQAVQAHKLENFEGDIWVKLEALAASEVQHKRTSAKISNVFRTIRRTL